MSTEAGQLHTEDLRNRVPTSPEYAGVTGVVYDRRFQQLSVNNIQCSAGTSCDINFLLSTMSAHSFSFFYPQVVQGTHTVNVYATLINPPATSSASACVGPATLTALQVKTF